MHLHAEGAMSDTREQIAETLARRLKEAPYLRAGQLVQNALDQAAERRECGHAMFYVTDEQLLSALRKLVTP